MSDAVARARVLAIEHKLASAEERFLALQGQATAAEQGLWDMVSGSGGLFGSIFNNGNSGGGGGPTPDCLTFTVKGAGCSSPVALAGATITVNDSLGNTVAFAMTDASGQADICLTDGQQYTIVFAASGHTSATITDTWPFPSTELTVVLGYPSGQICWTGCPLPMRADLLLTSKFGSGRLSTVGVPSIFQTASGPTVDPTCTFHTLHGTYQVIFSLAQVGSGYGGLTVQAYLINCGGSYTPWDGSPPTPNPRLFYSVTPSSVSCGPPFMATFDFSARPEFFDGVGPFTVTLDGT